MNRSRCGLQVSHGVIMAKAGWTDTGKYLDFTPGTRYDPKLSGVNVTESEWRAMV